MHRFFVPSEALRGISQGLLLPANVAHQVRDVLHMQSGEHLILLDNSGDELLCMVTMSNRTGVEVEPIERRPGRAEPAVHITLCQGMLKSARFEWILEKGTELGVSTFLPTICRRSISGLQEAGPSKIQRWQRIIQEATEQCGRSRLPELLPIRQFPQIISTLPDEALALIPWEEEREYSLRSALQEVRGIGPPSVVLFIGPEGGFTGEEIQLALSQSVRAVTLGSRILRAETAALATVANVLYELEH